MNGSALRTGIFVVALLLATVSGGMVVGADDTITSQERETGTLADQQAHSAGDAVYSRGAGASFQADDYESTTFIITINDDGSAIWTFRYERVLDGNDAEAEFEAFAEEFESEETEQYTDFKDQANALLTIGREETDREMEAVDFNRTANIEQRFNTRGVVEMSFTWEGFAQVDDGEIVAGDIFEGNFVIASDQTLVIEAGQGLTFTDIQPIGELSGPTLEESDSVTWTGRKQFLDGQPRVVLESESTGGAVEPGDNNGDESTFPARTVGMLLAGGIILLGLLAAGVYRYGLLSRTNRRGTDAHAESVQETETEPSSAQPIPDDELLSDEDRVVSLIQENGGRMKQVNIVDETGWSKSKVSMLLSEMESDGVISKLRVGRENIISLEGFEPEATKSPFEK